MGGGGNSGAAGLLYIGNSSQVGWRSAERGRGGLHTQGLIRFVPVDKEMDRFYLEESLNTRLILLSLLLPERGMLSAPC
jgi:hypothetical protein